MTEAARFERPPPPLELRPAGQWAGWAAARDVAPDGRVSISNLVLFQSDRRIRDVYLHEVAHSVLHGVPGAAPGHDCVFFTLNAALRLRVDSHQQRADGADGTVSLLSDLSIYDLGDLPEELRSEPDAGLGRCITWSLALAVKLASTELSAEAIAVEIVERYEEWGVVLRDQPRLDRVSRLKARGQAAAVDRLKDKLFLSNFFAGISSVLLMLVAVMLWHR
ncbi:MAG: hypothetical protein ABI702_06125 [Burkholderiales bacterium]